MTYFSSPSSPSYHPGLAGQQFLHHARIGGAGLGQSSFEGDQFGIRVGEDGGDGGLFVCIDGQGIAILSAAAATARSTAARSAAVPHMRYR